jgi:predicted nucleic acid-binding protein
MSGTKAILDTNVIIYASKQKIDTELLLSTYDEFYTSIISFMEVFGFQFQKQEELDLVEELFEGLEVVDVQRKIAEQVVIYRKSKVRKIKLPDAIILATAKYLGADLITDDWDDFQGIDPKVVIVKSEVFNI